MPYLTEYVDGNKGVLKTGVGVLTAGDVITSAIREGENPARSRQVQYGLIDLTQVTDMKVTGEQVRQVVEANRKTSSYTPPGQVRIATIAPNPLTYGMSRMWQMLADDLNWKIQIFRSRPAAIAWLIKELTGDDPARLGDYPTLQKEAEKGK